MSERFTIVTLPNESLSQMWPAIGPYLVAGASTDPDVDLEEEVARVYAGKSRVWVIVEGDRTRAAFLTSVVTDSDGRCLDVFGLGGEGMIRWGRALTAEMVRYSMLAECNRVIFKGRRALLRAYPGVRIVGEDAPGLYIFERAV